MRWTSVLAIYILFWTISLFFVLPFGVRTAEEAGVEVEPGHAERASHFQLPACGAPHHRLCGPVRAVLRQLSVRLGWLDDLDWLNR